MHYTSWTAGIRSGISPRVLCLPDTRQPLWRSEYRRRSFALRDPSLSPPAELSHLIVPLLSNTAVAMNGPAQSSFATLNLRPFTTLVDTKASLPTSTDRQGPTGCQLQMCVPWPGQPKPHPCPTAASWPGTRSTAARGWRTKGSPRTPSWSRRRAARCRQGEAISVRASDCGGRARLGMHE